MKRKILYVLTAAMLIILLATALTSCGIESEEPDLRGITISDSTVTYDGREHSIEINGTLPEGVTVEYSDNGKINAGEYTVTASFYFNGTHIEGADLTATLTINKASLTSEMEGITFSGKTFVYDGEAKSLAISGTLPAGVTVSYVGNGQIDVGQHIVTAKFAVDTDNYYAIPDKLAVLTIIEPESDLPEITGISFNGKTVTYDGRVHSLEIEGTLPEGVDVDYVNNDQTDAGSYMVEAKFYYGDIELEGQSLRARLKIEKATADLLGISFESKTVLYNGGAHSLAIRGTLPDYATVSYVGNGQTVPGTYKVLAVFNLGKNYESVPDMEATLTILGSAGDLSGVTFIGLSVSYDGEAHSIEVSGTLPDGVTVEYAGNGVSEVGTHTVVAKFYYNGEYIEGADKTAVIVINSANSELSHITFAGAEFDADGTPKYIYVSGTLPEGYTVEYNGNGETDPGEYTVTAKFYYNGEYVPGCDMVATYVIKASGLPEITVKNVTVDFDGKEHEITYTPAVALPDGVSVIRIGEAQYKPGTYTFTFRYKLAEEIQGKYEIGEDVTATLTINEYDDTYTSDPGDFEYLYISGGYTILGYTGDDVAVVIPATHPDDGKAIVSISHDAFRNNKVVKSVVVPDSVLAIAQGAFLGTQLEEITLPFIGGSAESSNKFLGYIFGASGYVANEIYVPVTLKRVVLSDACTYIPAYSFRSCLSVEEIVIGSGVTEIGISAFEKCESLKSIYIPATVTLIRAAANYYNSPFFDCPLDFTIYLEVGEIPTTYGEVWNYLNSTDKAKIELGISYEDYLAAINA